MTGVMWQECINCGVQFATTPFFDERRRADKRSFYCPNGHPQAYTESEADKLRRERDRLKQETARLEEVAATARRQADMARSREILANRSAAAYLGQVTKLRKRVGNGACPCCNRTFSDLQRHMQTKHPAFKAEEVAPEEAAIQ